jgi:hypothetical protein
MTSEKQTILPQLPDTDAVSLAVGKGEADLIIATSKRALRLHVDNGGGTCSFRNGNVAGWPGYAVAIHCCRFVSGKYIDANDIKEAITGHLPALQASGICIGTWYDEGRDVSWIEIVRIVWNLEEAECLALRNGQRAIYDLAARRIIIIETPPTILPRWPIVCAATA